MNWISKIKRKIILKFQNLILLYIFIMYLIMGINFWGYIVYNRETQDNNTQLQKHYTKFSNIQSSVQKQLIRRNKSSGGSKNLSSYRNNKVKKILFWGTMYNSKSKLELYCINETSMDFCKFKCEYTTDEKDLNSSDAIVIHGDELAKWELPAYRSANQRWVFLMFESPDNSHNNLSMWNNIFNWTMSYRKDSDVFIPYGSTLFLNNTKAKRMNLPQLEIPTVESIKNKSLLAWAVSNCNRWVTSSRKQLADELAKFVPLEIYGECGKLKCPDEALSVYICTKVSQCHKFLGTKYKFYLALENSICKDYITEKFFNTLQSGMIPIVFGNSRNYYETVGPPNSFIHLDDFKSVKALGNYLHFLDENPLEYLKYFEWRKKYFIDPIYHFQRGWCNLCTKLHMTDVKKNSRTKTYPSIHNWWFNKNDCKKKPS